MTNVTATGVNATYVYNADGKRVKQTLGSSDTNFLWDEGSTYGDGQRVKSVLTTNLGTTTTYFVGNYYEVTGGVVTKYYYAGAQRIAMRSNGTLYLLIGDHLGSTSLVTFANGNVVSETRYKAWGEERYSSAYAPTNYTYTGQYSDSYINLLWYGSRHYDPELGRFTQADSIVPNNIHGYDRYNYVSNRPTIMTDPTGHMQKEDADGAGNVPSCAKKVAKDAKADLDSLPISKTSTMDTYTVANIALQKGPGWYQPFSEAWNGDLASEGPAKVTDKEMETPYGELINDGHNGVGLGLRMPGEPLTDLNDQNVLAVAITAMSTRIQVRLDMCDGEKVSCTSTDRFLGAALGGDNGILPLDLQNLRNGIKDYGKPDPTTGIFQWSAYLDAAENKSHNLSVIQQFVDNVAYLQKHGAAVPDVNWTYVCGLLEK